MSPSQIIGFIIWTFISLMIAGVGVIMCAPVAWWLYQERIRRDQA